MTVSDIGNGQWIGLSTDTKPTTAAGSRFFETDTGDIHYSDGTYWWMQGFQTANSNRKIGIYPSGTSGTAGTGLLNLLTAATGAGTQNFLIDITNGRSLTGTTGTTVGNRGGLRLNAPLSVRNMNPRIRMRFKVNHTSLVNVWFGFFGGNPTEMSGADPFGAAAPGIVFGINTGLATNWAVMHNDSTGATVIDDTGIPFDTTTIHTVSMVADAPNNKFAWKLDSGSYNFVTTDIPSSVNSLSTIMENETQESGVAKTFQLYNWFLQSDL